MTICAACNGVIGRDCWNPQECQQISEQIESEDSRNERECWAEVEALQFDKIAEAIAQSADDWKAKDAHPDNMHMAMVCALKAATWRDAARSLRQPYGIRIEREARE